MKTRFNDVTVRLSLAIFLLFTLGLFASWSHAAEGTPGTETSNVSQKEQADRPTHPYQDYALFMAGISNPKGPLAASESSPAWGQFVKSFNESWKGLEVRRLTPIKEWAARELGTVETSRTTVFYPFSGADFANMYSFFPDAGTYVMISLERVGRIPDFPAMSKPNLEAFFTGLQRVNKDLFDRDYRITSEKGSIPGVRIVFQREGQERTQTLYYLRFDLARGSFDRNDKFVSFLKSFGPLVTFEKASSYLMFDPDFAAIRQFILDRSMHILQTDSGIPIKAFDPSIWNLKLFGSYQKLLPVFSYRHQKDLAELYQKTKNIPPISFGIGYHNRPGTANLLLATRKETPPPGDSK